MNNASLSVSICQLTIKTAENDSAREALLTMESDLTRKKTTKKLYNWTKKNIEKKLPYGQRALPQHHDATIRAMMMTRKQIRLRFSDINELSRSLVLMMNSTC